VPDEPITSNALQSALAEQVAELSAVRESLHRIVDRLFVAYERVRADEQSHTHSPGAFSGGDCEREDQSPPATCEAKQKTQASAA
jgi:hypothetical protein